MPASQYFINVDCRQNVISIYSVDYIFLIYSNACTSGFRGRKMESKCVLNSTGISWFQALIWDVSRCNIFSFHHGFSKHRKREGERVGDSSVGRKEWLRETEDKTYFPLVRDARYSTSCAYVWLCHPNLKKHISVVAACSHIKHTHVGTKYVKFLRVCACVCVSVILPKQQ